MVKVADVSERPLVAFGSGSSKRKRLVLWFIISALCRRKLVKPKLEKVPLEPAVSALLAVLLR